MRDRPAINGYVWVDDGACYVARFGPCADRDHAWRWDVPRCPGLYASVGRVKLGRRAWPWFWVVGSPQDEDVTTGSALTETDAWTAIAHAARAAGAVHLSVHHGWAQRKASQFARARRIARPPRRDRHPAVAPLEFAWTMWVSDSDHGWHSCPHRIVTRTPRFVFVDQEPYARQKAQRAWRIEHGVSDQEDYVQQGRPTYRLPRAEFEENQGVYVGPAPEIFYARPPQRSRIREHFAEELAALGLEWPCTGRALEAAYRRLVKHAHPDHGGTAAQFYRVRAAYGILRTMLAHHETTEAAPA
jgi:hypothetical protein